MKTLLTILCVFLSALFTNNPTLLGYTLLGSDWNYHPAPMGEPILVSENTSDTSGVLNPILNAMESWDNAGAYFKFTYGGNADNPAPKYDGVNQIRWEQRDGDSWLAIATWWSSGGKILEADIVFNDKYSWATGDTIPIGTFDVESVALHELGHVLGLGHSNAPAVMQPTISSGLKRRILTSDDINGIGAIYGSISCVDADGDGHYSAAGCSGTLVDCNDNDNTIYPGAPELCDGEDNDCNGQVDEGCCTDDDGDGFFVQPNCDTPQDCDDADPDVHPGMPELCDGVDNDCNGTIDEGCNQPDLAIEWLQVKKNGNNITGKLKVSNIGTVNIGGAFYVRVYLSADEVFHGGDTPIRYYQLRSLKAGSSKTLSFNYRGKGQSSYLIAVADPTQDIEESNEDNNVAIAPY